MTFEGDPLTGLIFGLGFAGFGLGMLIHDLHALHRNGWDFSRHSGLEWGEEVAPGERPKHLVGMAAKVFLIYPMFIIPGCMFAFGAASVLFQR